MSLSLGCHFGSPFVYVGCAQREPNGLKKWQAKKTCVSGGELLCLTHWTYVIGRKITQAGASWALFYTFMKWLVWIILQSQTNSSREASSLGAPVLSWVDSSQKNKTWLHSAPCMRPIELGCSSVAPQEKSDGAVVERGKRMVVWWGGFPCRRASERIGGTAGVVCQ